MTPLGTNQSAGEIIGTAASHASTAWVRVCVCVCVRVRVHMRLAFVGARVYLCVVCARARMHAPARARAHVYFAVRASAPVMRVVAPTADRNTGMGNGEVW